MLTALISILSRIPLRVQYFLSDYLIYPLICYVVRYRRKMVEKNLRLAFPDKSAAERKQLMHAFYRQFCDTIVEIIYGYRCSDEELIKRVSFEHADMVDRYAREKGGCIVMMAHMGNWEWMASLQCRLTPGVKEVNVYRRLKSESMDRLMLAIRGKRSGDCVEKQRILREMVRYRAEKQPIVVGLVSDQKPRPEVTRTWVEFLHQETGFLDGGEMLGKKFGYPVVCHIVRRPARGIYETEFQLLSEDPKNTADGEITAAYAKALEQNIIEQPELWLWTHHRFKWKRNALNN